MKLSPWILGAAALVPVAGAVAGSQISTDPIGTSEDVTAFLPNRPAYVGDASPRTAERLPDHYAMETPEGRVEVHELALRGRHADRWRAARAYEEQTEARLARLEARWDNGALESQAARLLDAQQPYVPRQRAASHEAAPQPLDLEQPQDLAAQDATGRPQMELAIVQVEPAAPRKINVQTELSLQR